MTKSNIKMIVTAAIAAALAAVCSCGGCGGGGGPVKPGYEPTPGNCVPGVDCPVDSALISFSAGQAWVDDYPSGNRDGFIVAPDGTVISVTDEDDGVWKTSATGIVFTVGDSVLTVAAGWLYPGFEAGVSASYSVSAGGDTLTLTDDKKGRSEVFIKTAGVTPSSVLAKGRREAASRKKRD